VRMQGTVSAFDDDTRAGSVLLDDGRELRFSGEAVHDTGLRLLRPGQRVSLDIDGEMRIRRLQILTLR
jgi:2-phospho-L-lactate guanylyltransferase